MSETGTFSSLVDTVVLRSARKDRISDIVSYCRSTIRECTVLALFDQALVEEQITVTAVPHIYERSQTMRTMLSIKYPYFTRQGKPVYPKHKRPGTVNTTDQYYFYVSGNSYIFAGVKVGDIIDLAYSSYAIRFPYYANVAERPATFDDETQLWTYLDAYDDTAELQEEARNKVSNWLLFYWFDLILEGSLAKLFKATNSERSKASFGLYKSMQNDLKAGEAQTFVTR